MTVPRWRTDGRTDEQQSEAIKVAFFPFAVRSPNRTRKKTQR